MCSITGANTTAYGAANSVQNGIVLSGNANITLYLDYIQVSNVSLGPLPIPADLNRDGIVNISDLTILAKAYGATPGDANWDPRANLDGDMRIDLGDLIALASHFDEKLPEFFNSS